MNIKLYKSLDDKKKLSKNLTNEKIMTGNVKIPTDIINPVIIIEYFANFNDFNYCYIEEFKRYYYIKDFNIIGKTIEINSHEDVLMSNKNSLLSLSATISRAENKPLINGYLLDDKFQAYSYKQITTKNFPNGINNDSIILITVG